jgi:hypothetical protein
MYGRLICLLMFSRIVPTTPLVPVWSPNHRFLASTQVPQRLVTPEGGNYELLLNGKLVYPSRRHRGFLSAYQDQHTFLSELAWSPNSDRVAFVEKIYDWQYLDPYNGSFDGWATSMQYFLAIVSSRGEAKGYRLNQVPAHFSVRWLGPNRVELNGLTFDLEANPPQPIR